MDDPVPLQDQAAFDEAAPLPGATSRPAFLAARLVVDADFRRRSVDDGRAVVRELDLDLTTIGAAGRWLDHVDRGRSDGARAALFHLAVARRGLERPAVEDG